MTSDGTYERAYEQYRVLLVFKLTIRAPRAHPYFSKTILQLQPPLSLRPFPQSLPAPPLGWRGWAWPRWWSNCFFASAPLPVPRWRTLETRQPHVRSCHLPATRIMLPRGTESTRDARARSVQVHRCVSRGAWECDVGLLPKERVV